MGQLEKLRRSIVEWGGTPGEIIGENVKETMEGVALGVAAIADVTTAIPGDLIENTVQALRDNLPTILILVLVAALVAYLIFRVIGNPLKGVGPKTANVVMPV